MKQKREFLSPYTHGFLRVAVCTPEVRVADPTFNVERTIALAETASADHAALALFPEMGLSAYSNDDLFQQDALIEASLSSLERLIEASKNLSPIVIVGAPLRIEQKLFNCGVAVYRGRILGVTPKSYLPGYREFYEKRQFAPARAAMAGEAELLGSVVPFGADLLFQAQSLPSFTFHIEICEDLWTPIPPSSYAALAGATVLANLSASNITIGKADYRKLLAATQSGRCVAAYLYSAAGFGESTTDLAWDGHALIYENGELLAESERFAVGEQVLTSDVDLELLVQDRMRLTSFADSVEEHRERIARIRTVRFPFEAPGGTTDLKRTLQRFPYVPHDAHKRDERCYEAYNIQVQGLSKRLSHTGIEKVVVGVSGGLDSTHALIVAARTADRLKLPRTNVLAYTMPGFATSATTRANALALMKALGVSGEEIDIRPACMQMFRDLKHPFAEGKPVYDITFENVQAGERTSHLFRLANQKGALVVGTGDLSELALGWATYGVGDHMSHYNVNASVPKTLIQYIIRWVIDSRQLDEAASRVLASILDTEISPELVPAGVESHGAAAQTNPAQSTEAKIGPYELQDFNLYYVSRFGFRPSKVAYLAFNAWHDRRAGVWPEPMPDERRHEYDLATIARWLELFLQRFFQTSQFKRSCIPNAPKVGSGGSLSPRGDWRAPSDSEAVVWLNELKDNLPDSP